MQQSVADNVPNQMQSAGVTQMVYRHCLCALIALFAYAAMAYGQTPGTIPSISTTYPECRETVRELEEEWRDQDANDRGLSNRLKSALNGWVEHKPGTCQAGGPPPVCPAAHWYQDSERAMAAFEEFCQSIADKRRSQAEGAVNACEHSVQKAREAAEAAAQAERDRLAAEDQKKKETTFGGIKDDAAARAAARRANATGPKSPMDNRTPEQMGKKAEAAGQNREGYEKQRDGKSKETEGKIQAQPEATLSPELDFDDGSTVSMPTSTPSGTASTGSGSIFDAVRAGQGAIDIKMSGIKRFLESTSGPASAGMTADYTSNVINGLNKYEWAGRGVGVVFTLAEIGSKSTQAEKNVAAVRGLVDLGMSFTPPWVSIPYTVTTVLCPSCNDGINAGIGVMLESIEKGYQGNTGHYMMMSVPPF